MKIVLGVGRCAVAAYLLVRVYQGSREALVFVLFLIFIAFELHALVIREHTK